MSTDLPKWLRPTKLAAKGGAPPNRKKRGPDSRAIEIQRLIGRAFGAAVDLTKMPGIGCDYDVIQADRSPHPYRSAH